MTTKCPQTQSKGESEVRFVLVSFADKIRPGQALTGTPTITQSSKNPATADDLTIDNEAVTSAAQVINLSSVDAGDAVQFTVADGTAGSRYEIKVLATTDGSPAETLEALLTLTVTT